MKTSVLPPLTAKPGGTIFNSTPASIFRSSVLRPAAAEGGTRASDLAESELLRGDFAVSDESAAGLEGYVTHQPLDT